MRRAGHAEASQAPIVGRTQELSWCLTHLREAVDGDARLVLLEGDAGAGKTTLIEAVVEHARRTGMATVASTACDDYPGQPGRQVDSLLGALGSGVLSDSDAAYRLSAAAIAAARHHPLVLVIDDLHWADETTQEAVRVLTAELSHERRRTGAPVLVLSAVRRDRPADVNALVASLARQPITRRVAVGPLREEEVGHLIAAVVGAKPAPSLLTDLMRITGGNPLLVQAALRCGADLQALGIDQGVLFSTLESLPTDALTIEADLQRRLDLLTPDARDLLLDVALSGESRTLHEIATVSARSNEEMAADLGQLLDLGLLTEIGTHYRFTHPQLRQVVAASEPLPTRQDRHRRLANRFRSLVADGSGRSGSEEGGQTEHPVWLDVAYHLEQAGTEADPDEVAEAAEWASLAAYERAAWSRAAHFAELALRHEPRHPGRSTSVAALHLRAGVSYFRNADSANANRHLRQAVELARELGDAGLWGDSLLWLARNRTVLDSDASPQTLNPALVDSYLAATDDRHGLQRALLCETVAEIHFGAGRFDAGLASGRQAWTALGERTDPDALTALEFGDGLNHLGRLDLRHAERCFERSRRHSQVADRWRASWPEARLAIVALIRGDPARAAEHAAEAERLAAAAGNWGERALAVALGAAAAARRGEWAVADERGEEAELLFERSEFVFVPAILYPNLAWARAMRGDRLGAEAALDAAERIRIPGIRRLRRWVEAVTLGAGSATLLADPSAPTGEPTAFTLSAWSATIDTEHLLGGGPAPDQGVGPRWDEVMESLNQRGVGAATDLGVSIERLRIISRMGRGEAGPDHLDRLVERLTVTGSNVEAVRARYDGAQALLAAGSHGEARRAREILRQALSDADELGLLPFVQRAHRLAGQHRERLDWDHGQDLPVAQWVLLYSDLVNSTQLNVRLGDIRHHELLREHNRAAQRLLDAHHGRQFRHHGDGVAAWFGSADQAIACALAFHQALATVETGEPDLALVARIGLVAGDVLVGDGDLHGLTVIRAVRVCAAAGPGQTFAGAEVVAASTPSAVSFRSYPAGEVPLKHLPLTERLFRLEPRATS